MITTLATKTKDRVIAGGTIRPEVDSFYHLNGRPAGVTCCNGLACFVARRLNPVRWAEAEKQSPRLYCLGQCFAGPSIAAENPRPRMEVCAREGVVLGRLAKGKTRRIEDYIATGGYEAFQKATLQSPEEIVRVVESSGLRGRGGAGFSSGRKWQAVCREGRLPKYIVANADEGDPGAYIDRFIIEEDPHALIEGMLIAARATGAAQGWIYLRKEYPHARLVLERALAEARRAGFVRDKACDDPSGLEIDIFVGQGSYVCGEETAMLNSIEGRRPEVRPRPPHAAQQGLWSAPTLVNNVETLATVPWIIRHGAETYHEMGFSNSRGTKVVSLNSLFRRPGLYEVEFGVTIRHIVEDLGGGLHSGELKGVIIGGPLAGIIPPHLLATQFGFEELQAIGASVGHGGVVVFDHHTSIAQLIHHVFSFGAYESCGKCTPCRVGSRVIENVFKRLLNNEGGDYWDEVECQSIIVALREASLCGFGAGLAEFAESALRYYRQELQTCFR